MCKNCTLLGHLDPQGVSFMSNGWSRNYGLVNRKGALRQALVRLRMVAQRPHKHKDPIMVYGMVYDGV